MSGDNDKLKEQPKPKTPEELKVEKIERCRVDPDKFIELDEIICATRRFGEGRVEILVNPTATRRELAITKVELDEAITMVRVSIKMAMMKNQKKIITPAKKIGGAFGLPKLGRRR